MSPRRENENDPEQLADELEREADDLDERSDGLEEKVMEVRREWEQKRADSSVPGAVPPDHDSTPEHEQAESPVPENADTQTPPSDSG